jgi:Ser/Thr protein kinase RdoA (MazF antagonist)
MERLIEKHYSLRVHSLARVDEGAGGDVYIADTNAGRFVLKGTKKDDERAQNEPRLSEYLARHDIPVPEFLATKDGAYFFSKGKKQYNLRPYVEGTVYSYNQAPAWLLPESARMQGKIHAALAGFGPLPTGVGPEFPAFMRSDAPRASYETTLVLARKVGDASVIEDIEYRLARLHKTQEHSYDYARLTIGNTHGDYKIQNLVCGEDRIAAVIDWTCANAMPLCLEVIRAYTHAAPAFDREGLQSYLEDYRRFFPLNDYDLLMMPYFYRDLLLACNYYGQYYGSKNPNRADYLAQARLATKVLRWFDEEGLRENFVD